MVLDVATPLLLKDIGKFLLQITFYMNECAFIALLLCTKHPGQS